MGKIVVYPNPVRPGFTGNIGIKGLAENANVKITDINGVLVYETTAKGGQATWDGKNFSNEMASSGVYLVLIVNKDGSDTAVGKILIVR
jgi:flagellar hook assembly protein FlgD